MEEETVLQMLVRRRKEAGRTLEPFRRALVAGFRCQGFRPKKELSAAFSEEAELSELPKESKETSLG